MTSRAGAARLGLHAQQHLLVGLAAQQRVDVGHRERRRAVDHLDHVALGDFDAGPGERRPPLGPVGVGPDDVIHAVAAGLVVARERGAERGRPDVVRPRPHVAAAHEDVERRQLAHHLRQEVAQLGAVGHAIDQRQVLGADGRPVEAVHAAVVEVVALEPPRLGEHLPPLVARVEVERPVARAEPPASRGPPAPSRRRRRRSRSEPLRTSSFLPSTDSSYEPRVVDERLRLRLLVVDGQRLQRGGAVAARGARHEVEALAVGREVAVVAGGDGHLERAASRGRRRRRRPVGTPAFASAGFAGLLRLRLGALRFGGFGVGFGFARASPRQASPLGGLRRRRRLRGGCSSSSGWNGERSPALQRDVVDLRLPVVERLGLPRPPRAADQRLEVAVRQEVEPLAVRAPRRADAVVAVRRHRGRLRAVATS